MRGEIDANQPPECHSSILYIFPFFSIPKIELIFKESNSEEFFVQCGPKFVSCRVPVLIVILTPRLILCGRNIEVISYHGHSIDDPSWHHCTGCNRVFHKHTTLAIIPI